MTTSRVTPNNDLGRLLLEIQSHFHLTVTELANRIGCHRSLLYCWMRGTQVPQKMHHIQNLARLCDRTAESLQDLITQARRPDASPPSAAALPVRAQDPGMLAETLVTLADAVFAADAAHLFLSGVGISLPCLWCAASYPDDSPPGHACISLAEYVIDWSSYTPRLEADLVVRAYATQQIQELVDAHFLHHLNIAGTWFLAAPLLHEKRSVGCLVFHSSVRTYLTVAEVRLLQRICVDLVDEFTQNPAVFDHIGMIHAARILEESYSLLAGGGDTSSAEISQSLAVRGDHASESGQRIPPARVKPDPPAL